MNLKEGCCVLDHCVLLLHEGLGRTVVLEMAREELDEGRLRDLSWIGEIPAKRAARYS